MSSGIEKFINREWITRAEIEVIIEETAISIAARKRQQRNVDAETIKQKGSPFLHRFLNETINNAISFQILSFNEEKDWDVLKNGANRFIDYANSIDSLITMGFPLKTVPQDLRREAKKIHAQLEQRDGSKRYSGRQAWESVFYPEALALYSVVFGEKPKVTANTVYYALPGATIVFLHYILEIVHDVQCELRFEKRFKELSNKPVTWKLPSQDALRGKVHKWKKYPLEVCEEEKTWSINARFYERFI